MKLSDVFAIPLSNLKYSYMDLYITIEFLTIVPGGLLWLVTFGGFRYFNLMDKLYSYLVKKDLDKNGYY